MTPEVWQQVNDLFAQVLEQPTEERERFLAAACSPDPAVRQEVESLLSWHLQAGEWLETPAFSMVGRRIGAYQVVGELGQGGMSAVYLAVRADEQYEQQVAIKLIKSGMESEAIVRRFLSERQILARLDHPNIARLIDGGTTESGLPYFVMEYIEGVPIDVYCDQNNLSIRERLQLFRTVCSAVHYAHQNLVVHRDLKPANILVTGEGVPKLLDFGIAKLLNPELFAQPIDPTVTAMGMMTPGYSSPEQLRAEAITTASDVYSLGVVLYELLTGHWPYRLKNTLPQELVRTIYEEEPERPSLAIFRREESAAATATKPLSKNRAGQLERLRRALVGDLDTIALMAMRKEPRRRYASVEQFSEDIDRHLVGRPVLARRDTLTYRSAKFIQRNRAGVAVGALIVALLVGGIAATSWQAQRAERRFNDVRQLANSFMFEIHDAIETLPGSTPARQLLVKKALDYLDSLDQESGDNPALQQELATAYNRIGTIQWNRYYANLGNVAGAERSQKRALAMREALTSKDPNNPKLRLDLVTSDIAMGDLLAVSGDTAGALARYRTAKALVQAAKPIDVPARQKLAIAHQRIGDTLGNPNFHNNLGDQVGALVSYRRALAIREALAAADPSDLEARHKLGIGHEKLGDMLKASGDTVRALQQYRQELAIFERIAAQAPANTAFRRDLEDARSRVAEMLQATGKAPQALQSARRALATVQALAKADPLNAGGRHDLAAAYLNLGDRLAANHNLALAQQNYRQALAQFEALTVQDPVNAWNRYDLASSHVRSGTLSAQTGEMTSALASFRRAQELYLSLSFQDPANLQVDRDLSHVWTKLARAYTRLGSNQKTATLERIAAWQQARSWFERSRQMLNTLPIPSTYGYYDYEASEINDLSAQIAACDAALVQLGTAR